MLNVRYLIQPYSEFQAQPGAFGNKFVPVFTSPDGQHVVLENRSVLPKAWLVPSVVIVTDSSQLLGMMQDQRFDPRRMALIESPPPIQLPSPAEAPYPVPGTVKVERYEGEHIALNVSTPSNVLLVMGEKYYRSWKATDNGKKAEIYPVNHVLRGVYLPPGDHRVEFIFDPWSFKVGKILTFASFSIFLVTLAWEWRRKLKGEGLS